MASLKIELNSSGIQAMLKSSEMQNVLLDRANTIQKRCGTGFGTDTKVMGTRAVSSVYTETKDAMQKQLEDNTLLKALK